MRQTQADAASRVLATLRWTRRAERKATVWREALLRWTIRVEKMAADWREALKVTGTTVASGVGRLLKEGRGERSVERDRGGRKKEGRQANLLKSASVTRGGDGVEEDWRGHRSKERSLSAAATAVVRGGIRVEAEQQPRQRRRDLRRRQRRKEQRRRLRHQASVAAEWKEEKEESRSLNYDDDDASKERTERPRTTHVQAASCDAAEGTRCKQRLAVTAMQQHAHSQQKQRP
ncbi:hypothetical protein Scep_007329 [Stephania cephalantha]|uniref:Uncharacterized protein n=1 Tax=Stephania cephalantha TaxID=152367 RepID=A0AAP0K9U9_9MAGN